MENQQQQNTPLCRAGCGFYGSSATEDLCSKCFKDMIKRKQETGTVPTQQQSMTAMTQSSAGMGSSGELETASTSDTVSVQSQSIADLTQSISDELAAVAADAKAAATPAAAEAATDNDNAQQQPGKKPNRCWVCNKRVGLTGFECRCGGLYCGEHRYDTAHDCTYDYKTAGREELRKKNPQVISDKIQKI